MLIRFLNFKSLFLSKINQSYFIWRRSLIRNFSLISFLLNFRIAFMSCDQAFEKFIDFLSLFDIISTNSSFLFFKLKFFQLFRVKIVLNSWFLFLFWRRSLINNFSRNTSILMSINHKRLKLHNVFSQSACFVCENILNLSKFFIYSCGSDPSFLPFLCAE